MKDKLIFGARSSQFVSIPALVIFAALAAVSAVMHFPWLCAAFAFFFFLCLTARWWGGSALKELSMTIEGSPAALFPPGEVEMQFRIKNGKNLPLIWLEVVQPLEANAPLIPKDPAEISHVVVNTPNGAKEADFLRKKFTFIMGHEEICWTSVWSAEHRGIFHPARLRLQAGDGFGLAQSERMMGGSADRCVAVYPPLQPVSANLFLKDMWEATSGARGYLEDPSLIKSTRNYSTTDPFKRINWRMTARTQQTVVNTLETISPKSAHFIVDCESFNGPEAETDALEDALSILTSLLLQLNASGIQCGISLPRGRTCPAQNIVGAEKTPVEDILYALAGYELQDVIVPEDPEQKPYTLPSRFLSNQILTLRNVGRFYYVCSRIERIQQTSLIPQLDPARTTLLPYTLSASPQERAFPAYSAVGLCSLKKEERS